MLLRYALRNPSSNSGRECLRFTYTFANVFGNPSYFSVVDQTGRCSLDKTSGQREGKLLIQTGCTPLKNWPCVTSCGHIEQSSHTHSYIYIYIYTYIYMCVCVCVCMFVRGGSVSNVLFTVVRNGLGKLCSNPIWGCWHFT